MSNRTLAEVVREKHNELEANRDAVIQNARIEFPGYTDIEFPNFDVEAGAN